MIVEINYIERVDDTYQVCFALRLVDIYSLVKAARQGGAS